MKDYCILKIMRAFNAIINWFSKLIAYIYVIIILINHVRYL